MTDVQVITDYAAKEQRCRQKALQDPEHFDYLWQQQSTQKNND